ncbi:WYL domain-containing protein [Pseudonocardiaceae bacterium YIM PH 21723]|nr:WYL domain-containing protein [Pseudonocardiaceae bacterium YIM PH 21723]
MSTVRTERLVNLVLCLLSTRQYLTAEKIRTLVAGYPDGGGDDAFFRMFERDKAELRDLGVPLESGRNSSFDTTEGYRIARRDYELGDIDLEPDEAAAVGLAARLWDSPDLTGAAHGALMKLRAAGVEVDQNVQAPVEPRVRAADPAFAPLLAAVQNKQAVTFDYRKGTQHEVGTRVVEPWGVVSWRGRWYLVGFDRDRQAPRCFRVSRVVGAVRTVGRAGQVDSRPPDLDLMTMVSRNGDWSRPEIPALLWVAKDRSNGLRRHATARPDHPGNSADGDIIEIEIYSPESAASWIAGFGQDVRVLEPEALRKTVHERFQGVLESILGEEPLR